MRFRTVTGMLMLVGLGLAGSAPGSVAKADDNAAGAEETAKHCVIELARDGKGRVGPMRCHDNAADALSDATGWSLSPPSGLSAAATGDWIETVNNLGFQSTVLSWEYDGQSFAGSSLYYTTSNPEGCTGGTDYHDSELTTWNNRIESVRAYAGCSVRHYDYFNFGGSTYSCASNCSSLGGLNNKVSSIKHT